MSKPLSERRPYQGPARANKNRHVRPNGTQGPLHSGGYYGLFKADRKAEADIRQAKRNQLSPQEQLNILDSRLGVGVGATRERARLTAMLK